MLDTEFFFFIHKGINFFMES
jgi:hypothetical protein